MEPSSSVTTGCPVANSRALGWRIPRAAPVMTAWTSAPSPMTPTARGRLMPWQGPPRAGGIPLQSSSYPPHEPPGMAMPPGMPSPPPPLPPPGKPPSTDLFLKVGVVFLGLSLAVGLIGFHAAYFVPAPASGTPPPSYQTYIDTVRMLGIRSEEHTSELH